MAAALRTRFEQSPLHLPGSANYLPSIKALFRALENVNDPRLSEGGHVEVPLVPYQTGVVQG
jgi:hypothetical protein